MPSFSNEAFVCIGFHKIVDLGVPRSSRGGGTRKKLLRNMAQIISVMFQLNCFRSAAQLGMMFIGQRNLWVLKDLLLAHLRNAFWCSKPCVTHNKNRQHSSDTAVPSGSRTVDQPNRLAPGFLYS
jgi:hypothetical protein